jgi:hypothetical protein
MPILSQDRERAKGGWIASGVGLIIVAIAIFGDEASFEAPRWVVTASGSVFLLAGALLFLKGNTPLANFILATLLTCFGAIPTWIAFGSGERQFEGSLSLFEGWFSGPAPEVLGRITFGIGALFLDAMALYLWIRLARQVIGILTWKDGR